MKSWKWKYLKELVKTFTIHEKNYLNSQKKLNKKHKIKDYNEVYDSIIKNDFLSEEKFKSIFKGKNISFEKAKFSKDLFTQLRNYNDEISVEISLHNALCDIEILFTKQLYEFCYEVVNYNLEICVHYELLELTLQFAKWKRKCLTRIGNIKLLKKELIDLKELERDCLLQINITFELRSVQQELLQTIQKKGNSFDEDDKTNSLQLLSQLNIDYSKIKSLTAQALYNEIHSWIAYYVHNDHNLALEYNTINYKLFKKNKHLIAVSPQTFLAIYSSYHKRSFLNKKNNTAEILKEIKELQVSKKMRIPEDVRVQAFMFYSEVEMLGNIDSEKFQEAIDLSIKNKAYLSKHNKYIKKSYLLINCFCVALAHFHLKQFSEALYYSKKNIDTYNDTIRLDYYIFNLTLNFMIHIELGNFYIYNHLLSTYKRTIKKHNLQDSEISNYLNFFQQIAKKGNPPIDLYLKTYEAIEATYIKNNKGTFDLHLSKWFLDKHYANK